MSSLTLLNLPQDCKVSIYTPLINYHIKNQNLLNAFFLRPFAFSYAHLQALITEQNSSLVTKVKNIALMLLEAIPFFNVIPAILEEKIDHYFIQSTEYKNTLAFLRHLNRHVRHIRTNIDSTSLSKILSSAQLFLLSDAHDKDNYQRTHGIVINALWQPRSKILSENIGAMTRYVKDTYRTTEMTWDVETNVSGFQGLEENNALIVLALHLLSAFNNWEKWDNNQRVESTNQAIEQLFNLKQLLKMDSEVTKNSCECSKKQLGYLLIEWRVIYFEVYKRRMLAFSSDGPLFIKRNLELAKNAIEQVRKENVPIFLIAGRAHLEYNDNHYDEKAKSECDFAVDQVFKALDEEKIAYVHFCPRSHPSINDNQNPDAWKPRNLSRIKNKLIPLDQLNVLADSKPLPYSFETYEKDFMEHLQIYKKKLSEEISNIDIIVLARNCHLVVKKMQQEIEALES